MSESILIKLAVNISVHMVIVGPCGDEQIAADTSSVYVCLKNRARI